MDCLVLSKRRIHVANDTFPNNNGHIKTYVTVPSGYQLFVIICEPPIHHDHSIQKNAIKTVFFIHGVAGSTGIWVSQINHFNSKGYKTVAFDLLGHGFSNTPNKPSLYEFSNLTADALYIFDKYCGDENSIVSHSYGCSLAAVIANDRASTVKRLVMIGPGAPRALLGSSGVFNSPTCLFACLHPLAKRLFRRYAFGKKAFSAQAMQHRAFADAFSIPPHVLKYTMQGQVWHGGDREFFGAMRVAALVVHGRLDQLVCVEHDREMFMVLPNAEFFEVPNAGHMVMIEQPLQLNRLIDEFISPLRPPIYRLVVVPY